MRITKILFIAIIMLMAVVNTARAEMAPGQEVGELKVETEAGASLDLGNLNKPYIIAFFISGGSKDAEQLIALKKLMAEKKDLADFYKVYVITRGLDNQEKSRARTFLKDNDISFPLLFDDPKSTAARRYGATAFPSFFVLDKEGILRAMGDSFTEPKRNLGFVDYLDYIKEAKVIPFIDLMPKGRTTANSMKLMGKEAPDFTVKDLKGKEHKLSDLRGKKNVVLIFWSPTCGHCQKELPQVQHFYLARRIDYDFEVFAIASAPGRQGQEMVKEMANSKLLTFPVIAEEDEKVSQAYGIQYVPCTVFIDKEGIVREIITGGARFFNPIYNSIFKDPARLGSQEKEE